MVDNEKDKRLHRKRYETDPEYRRRSIAYSIEYYNKNRERIRKQRIERKENGETQRRSYVKSPVGIYFFTKTEYQNLLVSFILSGITDRIIDIFYQEDITYRKVFRYLPSHRTDDKEAMKKEYKKLKGMFTEEKTILTVIKEGYTLYQ